MDFEEIEEEVYRSSRHPSGKGKPRCSYSIEFIQDLAFKTAKLSGYTPPLSEADLEDWTDLYHNEIKDLDTDAIIKKYDVKFYEPVDGLMELTIYY